jgi:hypothetical protein
LASEEARAPGKPAPKGEAIGRCLTIGRLDTGEAGSLDWRLRLTPAGSDELIRRSRPGLRRTRRR